jgi:hypothetical protein
MLDRPRQQASTIPWTAERDAMMGDAHDEHDRARRFATPRCRISTTSSRLHIT